MSTDHPGVVLQHRAGAAVQEEHTVRRGSCLTPPPPELPSLLRGRTGQAAGAEEGAGMAGKVEVVGSSPHTPPSLLGVTPLLAELTGKKNKH